jgi:hypothetical protein
MKLNVRKKTTPQGKFFYVPIGSDTHGRPSLIVWIGREAQGFVQGEGGTLYIEFPLKGAAIEERKGRLILKKGRGIIYLVRVLGREGAEITQWESKSEVQGAWFGKYSNKWGKGEVGLIVLEEIEPLYVEWAEWGPPFEGIDRGVDIYDPYGCRERIEHTTLEELLHFS